MSSTSRSASVRPCTCIRARPRSGLEVVSRSPRGGAAPSVLRGQGELESRGARRAGAARFGVRHRLRGRARAGARGRGRSGARSFSRESASRAKRCGRGSKRGSARSTWSRLPSSTGWRRWRRASAGSRPPRCGSTRTSIRRRTPTSRPAFGAASSASPSRRRGRSTRGAPGCRRSGCAASAVTSAPRSRPSNRFGTPWAGWPPWWTRWPRTDTTSRTSTSGADSGSVIGTRIRRRLPSTWPRCGPPPEAGPSPSSWSRAVRSAGMRASSSPASNT